MMLMLQGSLQCTNTTHMADSVPFVSGSFYVIMDFYVNNSAAQRGRPRGARAGGRCRAAVREGAGAGLGLSRVGGLGLQMGVRAAGGSDHLLL